MLFLARSVSASASVTRSSHDFCSAGWVVVGQAASGEEALAVAEAEQPDVLVLDVMLGDMDGFEVADRLSDSGWPLGIVLISAYGAETYATRLARVSGDGVVVGFVAKSDFSADALLDVLGRSHT